MYIERVSHLDHAHFLHGVNVPGTEGQVRAAGVEDSLAGCQRHCLGNGREGSLTLLPSSPIFT